MRQMHVEVEIADPGEPAASVQVPHYSQRCTARRGRPGFPLSLVSNRRGDRRPQAPAVLHRNSEPLHEGTRVPAEALLRIAVMAVLQVALLHVVGLPHVVMRANDEAGSFAPEELPNRLDLLGGGHLLGDVVVQAEHEKRVGVGEDSLVEWQGEARLVDTLKHGNHVPRDLLDHVLEVDPRPEEEFE